MEIKVNKFQDDFEIKKNVVLDFKNNSKLKTKHINNKQLIVEERINKALIKTNKDKSKNTKGIIPKNDTENYKKNKKVEIEIEKELDLDKDNHEEMLKTKNTQRKNELIKSYRKNPEKYKDNLSDDSITELTDNIDNEEKMNNTNNSKSKNLSKLERNVWDNEEGKRVKYKIQTLFLNQNNTISNFDTKNKQNDKNKNKSKDRYMVINKNANFNSSKQPKLSKKDNNETKNNFFSKDSTSNEFAIRVNGNNQSVFDQRELPQYLSKNEIISKSYIRQLKKTIIDKGSIPYLNDVLKIDFSKENQEIEKRKQMKSKNRPKSSTVIKQSVKNNKKNLFSEEYLLEGTNSAVTNNVSNLKIKEDVLEENKEFNIDNLSEDGKKLVKDVLKSGEEVRNIIKENPNKDSALDTIQLIAKHKDHFKHTNKILKDIYSLAIITNSLNNTAASNINLKSSSKTIKIDGVNKNNRKIQAYKNYDKHINDFVKASNKEKENIAIKQNDIQGNSLFKVEELSADQANPYENANSNNIVSGRTEKSVVSANKKVNKINHTKKNDFYDEQEVKTQLEKGEKELNDYKTRLDKTKEALENTFNETQIKTFGLTSNYKLPENKIDEIKTSINKQKKTFSIEKLPKKTKEFLLKRTNYIRKERENLFKAAIDENKTYGEIILAKSKEIIKESSEARKILDRVMKNNENKNKSKY